MGSSPSLQFRIVSSKIDALALLRSAEEKDSYLTSCMIHRANALARENNGYAPNTISYHDLKFFEVMIENAKPLIPQRLNQDLHEVSIVSLLPSADGGMPHTRPQSLICYPDISRHFQTSTLIHELWHIHQRLYHRQWMTVFNEWGWEPWDGELPPSIEQQRRFNPDTLDTPLWIYQKTWVPVPVFRNVGQPRLADTDIWFYQPYTRYHAKIVPHEFLEEYPDAPPSAYEHPRELAAYLLSEPDRYRGSPGFQTLVSLLGETSIKP